MTELENTRNTAMFNTNLSHLENKATISEADIQYFYPTAWNAWFKGDKHIRTVENLTRMFKVTQRYLKEKKRNGKTLSSLLQYRYHANATDDISLAFSFMSTIFPKTVASVAIPKRNFTLQEVAKASFYIECVPLKRTPKKK